MTDDKPKNEIVSENTDAMEMNDLGEVLNENGEANQEQESSKSEEQAKQTEQKSREASIRERALKQAKSDPNFVLDAVQQNPDAMNAVMQMAAQQLTGGNQQAQVDPQQQEMAQNEMSMLYRTKMAGEAQFGDDWQNKMKNVTSQHDDVIRAVLYSDPNAHETIHKLASNPKKLDELAKLRPEHVLPEIYKIKYASSNAQEMPDFKPIEELRGTGSAKPTESIEDEMARLAKEMRY